MRTEAPPETTIVKAPDNKVDAKEKTGKVEAGHIWQFDPSTGKAKIWPSRWANRRSSRRWWCA